MMLDQILLNNDGEIEIDVYFNGALTTPTSIKISELKDENGTTLGTDLAVTAGSTTGRYSYTVSAANADAVGTYTAVWQFVIGGDTYEHEQLFLVVETIQSGYITPYEVRAMSSYSNLPATDEAIQKFIDAATDIINDYIGGSLEYSQYTDSVRVVFDKPNDGFMAQLSHRPIVSVSSVTLETRPGSTQAISTDYLRVRNDAGIIQYFYGISSPYTLCVKDWQSSNIIPVANVTYTAGFVSIPAGLKRAALIITEDLIKETNGDNQLLSKISIGEYSETYSLKPGTASAKEKLGDGGIVSAMKMLNKYRQPSMSPGITGPHG